MDTTEEHANKLKNHTDHLTLNTVQHNEWVGDEIKVKAWEKVPESLASIKWDSQGEKGREMGLGEKINKSNNKRIFPKTSKDMCLRFQGTIENWARWETTIDMFSWSIREE